MDAMDCEDLPRVLSEISVSIYATLQCISYDSRTLTGQSHLYSKAFDR